MLLASFWWGDTSKKTRIHWRSWDSLCVSKMDGGVGFRDLEAFNLALLAKQWWRMVHNKESLSYKVLKAKYFPFNDPSDACLGCKPSFL